MGDVLETVAAWARRSPGKRLYTFLDVRGEEVAGYSYAAFLQRAELIAGHLTGVYGLRAGDRALLGYPPGLEMICTFFACVRAGVIPAPVAAPTPHGLAAALRRIDFIGRDCEAAAVLTTAACRQSVGAAAACGPPWIATDEMIESAGSAPERPPADVLFLQYTSGSTNHPKGVVVSHDNILANCAIMLDHADPVAVTWLPHHHDLGLIAYYLDAAIGGGSLFAFAPTAFIQRPGLWLETIARVRATASSAPAFALDYCLRPGRIPRQTLERLDLSSLRILNVGAEPVRPQAYRDFLRAFEPCGLDPASFHVAYGLAENTIGVSSYGRQALSLSKRALGEGRVRLTRAATGVGGAAHLMSCGRPLGDNRVAIVDPDRRTRAPEGAVGEIWVTGASKCRGYWARPEESRATFEARIEGEGGAWLRTGDLGFLHGGELFVCGRRKDLIIVRGQNYYPQDVEAAVEAAAPAVRRGCVAAFETGEGGEATVTVIAEVGGARAAPDGLAVARAVREATGVDIGEIVFVRPKSVPRTSSGKIMRFRARQMWQAGEFAVVDAFARRGAGCGEADGAAFGALRARYGLTGAEPVTLIDAGVDSLDLVLVLHELSELLAEAAAEDLAAEIDAQQVQQLTVAQLCAFAARMADTPGEAVADIRAALRAAAHARQGEEHCLMQADRAFAFGAPAAAADPGAPRSVLMTGGSGFLGPFLLASLLEQTDARVRVLIRAGSEAAAAERLRQALERSAPRGPAFWRAFEDRVVAIPGDLERPRLGLDADAWRGLAADVDTVFHNGAAVNYLFNYARLRSPNVLGTREVLRLAFEGRPKVFNHVSTTFVFGWSPKPRLYESDANAEMAGLDFGYSQSKWVAEQLVADAARQGLATRIFRPSLITPTLDGRGDGLDITLRVLAFMIRHGVGVRAPNQISFTPAEVAAANIVAIAGLPQTVGGAFHVTRDDYADMMDVTGAITRLTGRRFELFGLADFVTEAIRRCGKDDPLFPLLGFLTAAAPHLEAMAHKRYDSAAYQRARGLSPWSRPDPPLDHTVAGILKSMQRTGLVGPLALRPLPQSLAAE